MLKWICTLLFLISHVFAQEFSTVHIFGDSHSLEFRNISRCNIHYLGPITMHRIGRDGINIHNSGIKEKDAIVFCFGEIDIRCHILKQVILFHRSQNEVIWELATKYIEKILVNRSRYKDVSYIVYSITPPTDIVFNPDFPYFGSIQDRVAITKQLNSVLADLCRLNDLLFLNVYKDYALEDGTLNPDLSDGNVHINYIHNNIIQKRLFDLLYR